jgi:SAM-dependent methyltransferase
MPRIQRFVPADTILEIAPGFGRCTHYLKDLCRNLVVVDLSERCIEACRQRFAESRHITYHVNDGKSLDAVEDGSVDFAFSYDSLVHAEADVLRAYLVELERKLKPDGVGFIHHSNLGAYVRSNGRLPPYLANAFGNNWRAESVTADVFARLCGEAGLECVRQELVVFYPESSLRGGRRITRRFGPFGQWLIDRTVRVLNDCFSVFTRPGSSWSSSPEVFANRQFTREVRNLARLSRFYGPAPRDGPAADQRRGEAGRP